MTYRLSASLLAKFSVAQLTRHFLRQTDKSPFCPLFRVTGPIGRDGVDFNVPDELICMFSCAEIRGLVRDKSRRALHWTAFEPAILKRIVLLELGSNGGAKALNFLSEWRTDATKRAP